jgi:hypothetical protein
MKKIMIVLTAITAVFLVACGTNGTSKKAVEEGKVEIVSKEYEKGRDLFKLAVDEDSRNLEAKSLLDLSNEYITLMSMINTGELDKSDELISKIEKNDKLSIIKDEFEKTKDIVTSNKEKILKNTNEIKDIENIFESGNIDKAKSLAMNKLVDVKEIKSLEDRLNSIIKKVDESISIAKSEILKYEKDVQDISYIGVKTFDESSGVFSDIKELKGKTMYHFDEVIEDSPKEYVYDKNTKDVFMLTQGQVFWLSNGNIHVNKTISEKTALY